MKADTDKVNKLLYESGISRYKVSKDTGIAQSTLSDIATGKVKVENMSMSIASRLTSYYEEIVKMVENKEVTMEDVNEWLFEGRTAVKYDVFKTQPEILEDIQPKMLVDLYTSTLKEEAEECDYKYTVEQLADAFNLDTIKEDVQFIMLTIPGWGDTTNATTFYLSDITSKEDFISLVNEALEIGKVTHSSGLQPRYQIN